MINLTAEETSARKPMTIHRVGDYTDASNCGSESAWFDATSCTKAAWLQTDLGRELPVMPSFPDLGHSRVLLAAMDESIAILSGIEYSDNEPSLTLFWAGDFAAVFSNGGSAGSD
jgi:hypothetical protein